MATTTTTILGKVGLTPKGAWAEGTAYERLDVVSHGYASYLSLTDNNTAAVSDTTKWMLLVDTSDEVSKTNAATEAAKTATANADTATSKANTAASNADTATGKANTAASNADAATANAKTAIANADTATANAKTATANAETATTNADTATSKANTAASNADTATSKANTAASNADTATANAEKVNATLSSDNVFTVTSRDGTQKTLDLASPADVSQIVADVAAMKESYIRVRYKTEQKIFINGTGYVTCPAMTMTKIVTSNGFRNQYGIDSKAPLQYIDLSHWDSVSASKVMNYNIVLSLNGATELLNVDVSMLDTSTWTSLYCTFYNCNKLTSLDVSGWDTSSVTNMQNAFYGCHSLTSLDVSGWDTSKVTNMYSTFTWCRSLTALDVSGWDTSSVTNMYSTFTWCSSLTALDVSGWDTSSVTNIGGMFYNCTSLTALDVSGWDTSSVTNIGGMFYNCQKLASLKFGSGWGTQTSTEADALTLDLSGLNSSGSYQLSDETWSSMLTMHDRATAGLTAMTIKIKSTANIPDGWETQMAALGYTITKV